jgi:hypothetical protein
VSQSVVTVNPVEETPTVWVGLVTVVGPVGGVVSVVVEAVIITGPKSTTGNDTLPVVSTEIMWKYQVPTGSVVEKVVA